MSISKSDKKNINDDVSTINKDNLDFSLTDSDRADSIEQIPDIEILCNENEADLNQTDVISISNSKSIVSLHDRDLTIRSRKSLLQKMTETKLLDAHDFKEKRIIHPNMDNYRILNTYREIRTKLIQKGKKSNFITMVVSLQHDMGATFNAVNLATAFSFEGEKTSLIVDCNLNREKLSKYFDSKIEYGLTDYLCDESIQIDQIIYPTGINRMRYIPIGNKKETIGEFFSSERMREFVTILKKRYADRYIFLNVPPIEISADSAILADVCDFIVFIIPYGKVSNSRLQKALKFLPKEKIAGFIVNNKKKYV